MKAVTSRSWSLTEMSLRARHELDLALRHLGALGVDAGDHHGSVVVDLDDGARSGSGQAGGGRDGDLPGRGRNGGSGRGKDGGVRHGGYHLYFLRSRTRSTTEVMAMAATVKRKTKAVPYWTSWVYWFWGILEATT